MEATVGAIALLGAASYVAWRAFSAALDGEPWLPEGLFAGGLALSLGVVSLAPQATPLLGLATLVTAFGVALAIRRAFGAPIRAVGVGLASSVLAMAVGGFVAGTALVPLLRGLELSPDSVGGTLLAMVVLGPLVEEACRFAALAIAVGIGPRLALGAGVRLGAGFGIGWGLAELLVRVAALVHPGLSVGAADAAVAHTAGDPLQSLSLALGWVAVVAWHAAFSTLVVLALIDRRWAVLPLVLLLHMVANAVAILTTAIIGVVASGVAAAGIALLLHGWARRAVSRRQPLAEAACA
ncbi:hypothetical protein [Salinarimonas sp.]|uniref:hypothetical protein n=1 Tax=Salinarimonas sp. TaxID=2766526 RepID=UPI0032D93D0A